MHDGAAEGGVRRAVRVCVNPLGVAGELAKAVDVLLADAHPGGFAQGFADARAQVGGAFRAHDASPAA